MPSAPQRPCREGAPLTEERVYGPFVVYFPGEVSKNVAAV